MIQDTSVYSMRYCYKIFIRTNSPRSVLFLFQWGAKFRKLCSIYSFQINDLKPGVLVFLSLAVPGNLQQHVQVLLKFRLHFRIFILSILNWFCALQQICEKAKPLNIMLLPFIMMAIDSVSYLGIQKNLKTNSMTLLKTYVSCLENDDISMVIV